MSNTPSAGIAPQLAQHEIKQRSPNLEDLWHSRGRAEYTAAVEDRLDVSVMHEPFTQLVVLNGDLVSGYDTIANNVTRYLDQAFAPIRGHGLPWAVTYGNHDNERFSKSRDLLEYERMTYPDHSLTKNMGPRGREAGVSNYYLEVLPAETSDVPALLLWFFDSRGGAEPHDWVDDSVVQWFVEANADLVGKYNQVVPSLAFFHIPITAAYDFQIESGVDASREPGNDGEKVWWQGRGYDGKTGHDVKFMSALSSTEGMLATFSGHDHDNDWCFKWRSPGTGSSSAGLNVCYGRHTGYGGYGDLPRGARQIMLKHSTLTEEVMTWIRLEDGGVPENVTLNATYGQDEYHPHSVLERIDPKRSMGINYDINQGIQLRVSTLYLLTLALLWWTAS
ncbi:Metallo-dependent phosphatase-like protein [Aspergillus crustosus]